MNKVSLVIPVYNAENKICNLIKSLINQTDTAFTTIFIDDCSTDNSVSKIKKCCDGYLSDYKIIESPSNGGAGKSRNIGMREVCTEYCMFVDADDWLSNNYIEEMVSVADKENYDVVFSGGVKIWDDGHTKTHYNIPLYKKHLDAPNDLMNVVDYGPCGKLFKKSLWTSSCEFPDKIHCEDLASIPVLINTANSFAVAENAIYYYYQTKSSRSRNSGKSYEDIFKACEILEERIGNVTDVEYFYVSSIMYGLLMNAILCKEPNKTLSFYTEYIKRRFPNGYKNTYLKNISILKRVFIYCAYFKAFPLLRLMVLIAK